MELEIIRCSEDILRGELGDTDGGDITNAMIYTAHDGLIILDITSVWISSSSLPPGLGGHSR